jgi:hypothetical protein
VLRHPEDPRSRLVFVAGRCDADHGIRGDWHRMQLKNDKNA